MWSETLEKENFFIRKNNLQFYSTITDLEALIGQACVHVIEGLESNISDNNIIIILTWSSGPLWEALGILGG